MRVVCPNCGNIQQSYSKFYSRCKKCKKSIDLAPFREAKEVGASRADINNSTGNKEIVMAEPDIKGIPEEKKQEITEKAKEIAQKMGKDFKKEDLNELDAFYKQVKQIKDAEPAPQPQPQDNTLPNPQKLWDCGVCGAKEVLPFGQDCFCPKCGERYTVGDWKNANSD